MADLAESASWEAGIYQLETTDPVLGGPDGIDNLQAKQLANRTTWLKALIESVQTAYAPKASPALTGTPTAPTAAPGTNTTQLANTAFVQAAVAALVASSPAALDTLNELATALGNDANFATTMTNALAGKQPLDSDLSALAALASTGLIERTGAGTAGTVTISAFIKTLLDDANAAAALATLGAAPLASPALNGTPTAPTAAPGTNTTQLANTAFVQAAVAALVAASPAALDTLNELAAALGNDPNFATTITNALAGKQPLDDTLTALAALATAADKLIYSTGSDVFATTPLTAKARTLLASANEEAMRTFLQLVKQSAANDTTAGAMLAVGAFGNGAPRYVMDADDVTLGADHVVLQSPFTHGPTATTHYIFSMCSSVSSGGQLALTFGLDRLFFRKKAAGAWSAWVEVWHAANLAPAELSPPGAVAHFARNSAPTGWIKANGAAVSRTTYAALFAAIGTQFGTGDGSTTFSLPDLRGEFLRSWDDARGVDTGRAFGSAQRGTLYGFDAGTAAVYVAATSGSGDLASVQDDMGADPYATADYPQGRLVTLSSSSTAALPGSAGAQAGSGVTRPRNIALLACIKY